MQEQRGVGRQLDPGVEHRLARPLGEGQRERADDECGRDHAAPGERGTSGHVPGSGRLTGPLIALPRKGGRQSPTPTGPLATRASTPTNAGGFAAALARAECVEGWLTDGQARRLWERARRVAPGATIVEIGSYHGRSAIVLARRAAGGDRGGASTPTPATTAARSEIRGTIDRARPTTSLPREPRPRRRGRAGSPRRGSSGDALGAVQGAIDLLYIDGAHRYRSARDDIARLGRARRAGRSLLVHDSFSAIGVTGALATCLLFGSRFRYVGREGSLAEYRHADLGPAEVAPERAAPGGELPWFARNVALKVAIAATCARCAGCSIRTARAGPTDGLREGDEDGFSVMRSRERGTR